MGETATPAEVFQQHEVSPPHNSQTGEASAFQRAFPNVRPHASPDPPSPRSRTARGRPRHSLRAFWEEHVPESLKTFNIPMRNVYRPVCMTPTEEQVESMAARSKCMELLREDHPSLLASPNKSIPLCFVARAAEGLPIHMQKALFFFTSVNNSIVDIGHYAAPTVATDVLVRLPIFFYDCPRKLSDID